MSVVGHWPDRACRDADLELFFPGSGVGGQRQAALARAICRNCPVLIECREWGIRTAQPSGIIGGLTEHQRRLHRIRKPRARKASA